MNCRGLLLGHSNTGFSPRYGDGRLSRRARFATLAGAADDPSPQMRGDGSGILGRWGGAAATAAGFDVKGRCFVKAAR